MWSDRCFYGRSILREEWVFLWLILSVRRHCRQIPFVDILLFLWLSLLLFQLFLLVVDIIQFLWHIQQRLGADLHRRIGLQVELLILLVAEACAHEYTVALADDDGFRTLQSHTHQWVLIQHTCILQGLVVAEESADDHPMDLIDSIDIDLEVTHQEIGEVILRQVVEQLVLVHGVRVIGEHEHELLVAFLAQRIGHRRIARCQFDITFRPEVADIELSSVQSSAFLYTLDDHTCQWRHLALRIFLHHLTHILQTLLRLSVVQLTQSFDEDELITVGPLWETLCRQLGVGAHLTEAVSLEGLVGSGIEGVFDMGTKTCVLCIVGVGEQDGPLTLRMVFLHEFECLLCLSVFTLS